MEEIELKLHKYLLTRADYSFNKNFVFPTDSTPVDINSKFNRSIRKLDKDNALITLAIIIEGDKNPFQVYVEIDGFFNLTNWEENEERKSVMIENSTAILFPYLRQAVSTLTSLGGVSPFVLPVMNTFNLFNKKK